MKLSKIIPVCLLFGAALSISQSSSAQIRLGAISTTHLTAATSLNTASVGNALRASTAASANATHAAGSAASGTMAEGQQAATKTEGATRQIEGKTTTAVNSTASAVHSTEGSAGINANGGKNAGADASGRLSMNVTVAKQ